jgi:hypothetical protein
MIAHDPADVVLPSEVDARAIEAGLMFRRPTIRIVHVAGLALTLALVAWSSFSRSALLTPVGVDFHAGMIGLGVFGGVLLAFVERDGWTLGLNGGRNGPPRGLAVPVVMLVWIGAGGVAGHFLAARLWDWRAFHGLAVTPVAEPFTVTGRYSGRHGESVTVRDAAGATAELNCSWAQYEAAPVGARLSLPVETGRGGVRRVSLPAADQLSAA